MQVLSTLKNLLYLLVEYKVSVCIIFVKRQILENKNKKQKDKILDGKI